MCSRKVWTGIAAAIAWVAGSGVALAQAPSGDVAMPRFPVEFEASRPGVSIAVTGVALDLPCGERCVLELPEGRYRVTATTADGGSSAESLMIRGPSRVTVTPHNRAARTAALVLMPIGAGAAGVGALLLWWAGLKFVVLSMQGCSGGCYDRETSDLFWPGGAIVLGAGAVVGLTGVVLWMRNGRDLEMTPAQGSLGGTRLRFGLHPALGPRWGGLALTGSF